jgi:hypothetical protein
MPAMATAEQRYEIRVAGKSATIPYLVTEAASAIEARSAAIDASPATFNGMDLDDAEAVELNGDNTTYYVEVRYADSDSGGATPPEDTISDSFEVAVTPTLITHSRQTVAKYGSNQKPDFRGAINVDRDRRVNGVQWPPSTNQILARTKVVAASAVTEPYYRQMSALAGLVNSASFLGFSARELLFLGASGSRRGIDADDPWEITWKFAVSITATNIPIGPDITVTTKAGWDYLWVFYYDVEDTVEKMLVSRPLAAYVERIADEASFAGLIL